MPLTEDQFIKIVIDNDWMSFFDFKEILNELIKTKQIELVDIDDIKSYMITESGKHSLELFKTRLPISIRTSVKEYINLKNEIIKKETLMDASYTFLEEDKYRVECNVRDKNGKVFTVTIYTINETYAKKICSNWEKSSEDLYEILLSKLIYSDD